MLYLPVIPISGDITNHNHNIFLWKSCKVKINRANMD